MRNSKYRNLFFAICTFILLSVIALWSFNTLTELFGGPTVQYKHAIAGVGLLIILKWALFPGRFNRISGRLGQRHVRRS